ncbi:MAG: J domain-containing protein [Chloroflexota bacterium]|nr:J domain-containing protein [Chloroflexota bacterium]
MDPRIFPYSPQRDVYRLLEVQPSAGTDEILAACRRLSRAFHPDTNFSPRATQEMQVVNAVRRVLSNPAARAEYDVARLSWIAAASSAPIPRHPRPIRVEAPPRPISHQPSALERYVRAVLAGARAAVGALRLSRCGACRMVVDEGDAFCAACGGRLLTGRRAA